jgi:hypothetical protein
MSNFSSTEYAAAFFLSSASVLSQREGDRGFDSRLGGYLFAEINIKLADAAWNRAPVLDTDSSRPVTPWG